MTTTDAVTACVEEFFRATAAGDWDAALAVTADGMIAWQSGGPERRFADAIPYLRKMRDRKGTWEYLNVRRLVATDGFCEQHLVRFRAPDGSTPEFEVCAVGRVNSDGLMTRLDEYVVDVPPAKTDKEQA